MNESARLEAKSRSSIQNQPVPSAGLDSVDRTHGDPEENVHGPSRLNEVQSSDRSCEATYRVSISRISALRRCTERTENPLNRFCTLCRIRNVVGE